MGYFELYHYIKLYGIIDSTYTDLKKKLNMSIPRIRSILIDMERSESISFKETKHTNSFKNTVFIRYLKPIVFKPLVSQVIKAYAIELKKRVERTGVPTPNFIVKGKKHTQFNRIANIIKLHKLNPHLFIKAQFDSFPKQWCLSTFRTPYPPTAVMLDEKKGLERYYSYMDKINSVVERKPDVSFKERIERNYQVWTTIGKIENVDLLLMLVDNKTLDAVFVCALPFLEGVYVDILVEEHKIIMKDLEYAYEIIQGLK